MNKDWNYQLVATLMVSNNKKEEIMIEQTQMVQPVNASVQQNDKAARTLADLDRVMLADVRKHWVDFQSSRNRDAIYGYDQVILNPSVSLTDGQKLQMRPTAPVTKVS